MTAKNQRLVLVLLALAAVGAAALLALSALKDQAAFFYSPSDLAAAGSPVGRPIRLGGMVMVGSVAKLPDGVTTRFVVRDQKRMLGVLYRGIVPDLFKEGSGVVAEGELRSDGAFVASTILAKHDEKYMPPELARTAQGVMHETKTLR
jgi:cytochrome c-type biogenesis protein CcmE